ncbi:MAG: hypothetical protein JST16_05420 [Bdellovibrionales bacterium]|nr:hypothetical protein [Bdellovibrionales bacterium]
MNTTQTNQTTNARQKLTFLNIEGHFWSKDGSKLYLLIPGGIAIPVHVNFMKARMGIKYTPVAKKTGSEGTVQAPTA